MHTITASVYHNVVNYAFYTEVLLINSMKKKKRIIFILIFLLPVIMVFISNSIIEKYAENKTYSNSSEIKNNKVGLVLGTAKKLQNGQINLYFKYRIEATVALYNKGKISFVLISGDNGHDNYNEPEDFKNELIKKGIPEHKIYLDYAGFRTLDSVIRANKIFGQKSITIISQKFHNERAIYLAEEHGITAIGFNAKDVTGKKGLKTQVREYFARTKAFLDIVFNVQPKFLGKKIEIQ